MNLWLAFNFPHFIALIGTCSIISFALETRFFPPLASVTSGYDYTTLTLAHLPPRMLGYLICIYLSVDFYLSIYVFIRRALSLWGFYMGQL